MNDLSAISERLKPGVYLHIYLFVCLHVDKHQRTLGCSRFALVMDGVERVQEKHHYLLPPLGFSHFCPRPLNDSYISRLYFST